MQVKPIVVTPRFIPPETYQSHLKRVIDPLLDEYTHILLIDADTKVEADFHELPYRYPDADVITVHVRPSSRVYSLWEKLTYWIRLEQRMRGSAVVYNTRFLKRLGGYPLKLSPDTWLLKHSTNTVQSDIVAWHQQSFSLSHSVRSQLRDGKSRVELGYPLWKTLLHSIFRLRPLVIASYLYQRGKAGGKGKPRN